MAKVYLATIFTNEDTLTEQMGICSISSFLRKNGHQVELSYVKENNNEDECITYVKNEKPDFIGFNVYYQGVPFMCKLSKTLKEISPFSKIVVGGYVATYYSNELFKSSPNIDYIVRGEGEIIFNNLINALENDKMLSSINGITYIKDGKLIDNEDEVFIDNLNELPFASRDFIKKMHLTTASISTSRGCTRNCSFCSTPDFWRKNNICWRGREPENIVDEIEQIVNTYNISNIEFIDASFEDPNFKRLILIADEIIKRNLKIVYTANFRVNSIKKMDDEIVNTLKKSGLRNVCLGVESGNQFDLDLYNKNIQVTDIREAITFLRKKEFNVEIGFINFNPYTTFEHLRENINFLHDYKFTTYLTNIKKLRLYRGCGIYELVKNDNLLISSNNEEFIHDYNFVNKYVGNLYSALDEFFTYDAKEHMYFYNFQYFSIYFFENLEGIYLKTENQKVLEYKEKVLTLLNEFADINYKWFLEVIEMAENGLNKESILKHTIKILYSEKCVAILKKLQSVKMRIGVINK